MTKFKTGSFIKIKNKYCIQITTDLSNKIAKIIGITDNVSSRIFHQTYYNVLIIGTTHKAWVAEDGISGLASSSDIVEAALEG